MWLKVASDHFVFTGNFSPDDIGEPILDVILEAGDLLYFPRGTIHQGRTLEDAHSMHITVSCCQKNTWADFFEKVLVIYYAIFNEKPVWMLVSPTVFVDYLLCYMFTWFFSVGSYGIGSRIARRCGIQKGTSKRLPELHGSSILRLSK